MKIKSSMASLAVRSLAESLDVRTMVKIVETIIPYYNIYERTGFPPNIPIQKQDAAQQIVRDILKLNFFFELIIAMIRFHTDGFMGRKYPIKHLKEILKEMNENGLVYDQVNRIFIEDSNLRKTRNWGTLREGEEYVLAFLRFDIVGSTKLVKKYPDSVIREVYKEVREMVQRSIDGRQGRIWSWEGDGGMIAFYFSNKNLFAALSGIEIIHNLFIYNQLECRLNNPISMRLSIHGGQCAYSDNDEDLNKNDVIKKLIDIESKYTLPNSLTISKVIKNSLDTQLSGRFLPLDDKKNAEFFNYQLRWEQ